MASTNPPGGGAPRPGSSDFLAAMDDAFENGNANSDGNNEAEDENPDPSTPSGYGDSDEEEGSDEEEDDEDDEDEEEDDEDDLDEEEEEEDLSEAEDGDLEELDDSDVVDDGDLQAGFAEDMDEDEDVRDGFIASQEVNNDIIDLDSSSDDSVPASSKQPPPKRKPVVKEEDHNSPRRDSIPSNSSPGASGASASSQPPAAKRRKVSTEGSTSGNANRNSTSQPHNSNAARSSASQASRPSGGFRSSSGGGGVTNTITGTVKSATGHSLSSGRATTIFKNSVGRNSSSEESTKNKKEEPQVPSGFNQGDPFQVMQRRSSQQGMSSFAGSSMAGSSSEDNAAFVIANNTGNKQATSTTANARSSNSSSSSKKARRGSSINSGGTASGSAMATASGDGNGAGSELLADPSTVMPDAADTVNAPEHLPGRAPGNNFVDSRDTGNMHSDSDLPSNLQDPNDPSNQDDSSREISNYPSSSDSGRGNAFTGGMAGAAVRNGAGVVRGSGGLTAAGGRLTAGGGPGADRINESNTAFGMSAGHFGGSAEAAALAGAVALENDVDVDEDESGDMADAGISDSAEISGSGREGMLAAGIGLSGDLNTADGNKPPPERPSQRVSESQQLHPGRASSSSYQPSSGITGGLTGAFSPQTRATQAGRLSTGPLDLGVSTGVYGKGGIGGRRPSGGSITAGSPLMYASGKGAGLDRPAGSAAPTRLSVTSTHPGSHSGKGGRASMAAALTRSGPMSPGSFAMHKEQELKRREIELQRKQESLQQQEQYLRTRQDELRIKESHRDGTHHRGSGGSGGWDPNNPNNNRLSQESRNSGGSGSRNSGSSGGGSSSSGQVGRNSGSSSSGLSGDHNFPSHLNQFPTQFSDQLQQSHNAELVKLNSELSKKEAEINLLRTQLGLRSRHPDSSSSENTHSSDLSSNLTELRVELEKQKSQSEFWRKQYESEKTLHENANEQKHQIEKRARMQLEQANKKVELKVLELEKERAEFDDRLKSEIEKVKNQKDEEMKTMEDDLRRKFTSNNYLGDVIRELNSVRNQLNDVEAKNGRLQNENAQQKRVFNQEMEEVVNQVKTLQGRLNQAQSNLQVSDSKCASLEADNEAMTTLVEDMKACAFPPGSAEEQLLERKKQSEAEFVRRESQLEGQIRSLSEKLQEKSQEAASNEGRFEGLLNQYKREKETLEKDLAIARRREQQESQGLFGNSVASMLNGDLMGGASNGPMTPAGQSQQSRASSSPGPSGNSADSIDNRTYNDLRADLQKLRVEYEILKAKLENQTQQLDLECSRSKQLKDETQQQKGQIQLYEDSIKHLGGSKAELEATRSTLDDDLHLKSKKVTELKLQLDLRNKKLQEQSTKLCKHDVEISGYYVRELELKSKVEKYKDEIREYKDQLHEIMEERDSDRLQTREEVVSLEVQVSQLLTQLEVEKKSKEETIAAIKSKYAKAQKVVISVAERERKSAAAGAANGQFGMGDHSGISDLPPGRGAVNLSVGAAGSIGRQTDNSGRGSDENGQGSANRGRSVSDSRLTNSPKNSMSNSAVAQMVAAQDGNRNSSSNNGDQMNNGTNNGAHSSTPGNSPLNATQNNLVAGNTTTNITNITNVVNVGMGSPISGASVNGDGQCVHCGRVTTATIPGVSASMVSIVEEKERELEEQLAKQANKHKENLQESQKNWERALQEVQGKLHERERELNTVESELSGVKLDLEELKLAGVGQRTKEELDRRTFQADDRFSKLMQQYNEFSGKKGAEITKLEHRIEKLQRERDNSKQAVQANREYVETLQLEKKTCLADVDKYKGDLSSQAETFRRKQQSQEKEMSDLQSKIEDVEKLLNYERSLVQFYKEDNKRCQDMLLQGVVGPDEMETYLDQGRSMQQEAEVLRQQAQNEMHELKRRHHQADLELQSAKIAAQSKSDENKQLRQKLNQVDGRIVEELQIQLRNKDNEFKVAQRELESLNDSKLELERRNVELEGERGPLVLRLEKMDDLQANHQDLQAKLDGALSELESHKQFKDLVTQRREADREAHMRNVQNQNAENQSHLQKKKREVDSLKQKLGGLEKKLAESETGRQVDAEKFERERNTLRKDIDSARESGKMKKEWEDARRKLVSEKNKLISDKNVLEQRLNQATGQVESIKRVSSSGEQEVENLKATVAEKEAMIANLLEKREKSREAFEKLKKQSQTLIAEKKARNDEAQAVSVREVEALKLNEALQHHLTSLSEKASRFEELHKSQQDLVTTRETQINKLQQTKREIDLEMNALKKQKMEGQKSHEQEKIRLQKQIAEQRKSVETADKRVAEVEEKMKKKPELLTQMQGMNATQRKEVDTLNQRVSDAEAKCEELRGKAQEERTSLQQEMDKLVASYKKEKDEQRQKFNTQLQKDKHEFDAEKSRLTAAHEADKVKHEEELQKKIIESEQKRLGEHNERVIDGLAQDKEVEIEELKTKLQESNKKALKESEEAQRKQLDETDKKRKERHETVVKELQENSKKRDTELESERKKEKEEREKEKEERKKEKIELDLNKKKLESEILKAKNELEMKKKEMEAAKKSLNEQKTKAEKEHHDQTLKAEKEFKEKEKHLNEKAAKELADLKKKSEEEAKKKREEDSKLADEKLKSRRVELEKLKESERNAVVEKAKKELADQKIAAQKELANQKAAASKKEAEELGKKKAAVELELKKQAEISRKQTEEKLQKEISEQLKQSWEEKNSQNEKKERELQNFEELKEKQFADRTQKFETEKKKIVEERQDVNSDRQKIAGERASLNSEKESLGAEKQKAEENKKKLADELREVDEKLRSVKAEEEDLKRDKEEYKKTLKQKSDEQLKLKEADLMNQHRSKETAFEDEMRKKEASVSDKLSEMEQVAEKERKLKQEEFEESLKAKETQLQKKCESEAEGKLMSKFAEKDQSLKKLEQELENRQNDIEEELSERTRVLQEQNERTMKSTGEQLSTLMKEHSALTQQKNVAEQLAEKTKLELETARAEASGATAEEIESLKQKNVDFRDKYMSLFKKSGKIREKLGLTKAKMAELELERNKLRATMEACKNCSKKLKDIPFTDTFIPEPEDKDPPGGGAAGAKPSGPGGAAAGGGSSAGSSAATSSKTGSSGGSAAIGANSSAAAAGKPQGSIGARVHERVQNQQNVQDAQARRSAPSDEPNAKRARMRSESGGNFTVSSAGTGVSNSGVNTPTNQDATPRNRANTATASESNATQSPKKSTAPPLAGASGKPAAAAAASTAPSGLSSSAPAAKAPGTAPSQAANFKDLLNKKKGGLASGKSLLAPSNAAKPSTTTKKLDPKNSLLKPDPKKLAPNSPRSSSPSAALSATQEPLTTNPMPGSLNNHAVPGRNSTQSFSAPLQGSLGGTLLTPGGTLNLSSPRRFNGMNGPGFNGKSLSRPGSPGNSPANSARNSPANSARTSRAGSNVGSNGGSVPGSPRNSHSPSDILLRETSAPKPASAPASPKNAQSGSPTSKSKSPPSSPPRSSPRSPRSVSRNRSRSPGREGK